MLEAIELEPVERRRLTLASGHELWVSDDGTPLAPALVERLKREGITARVVGPRAGWRGIEKREVAGLILLAPPTDDEPLSAKAEAALKAGFRRVQRLAASLRQAAGAGGALLATVSRLDGHFGLTGQITNAIAGGYAGLAKTAAHEWPEVRCRALDVARDWDDADSIAEAILAELSSDGPLEAGLSPGVANGVAAAKRVGLALVERPTGAGRLPLAAGDVVVVTGGARGVTAACALALARSVPLTLVLLGRSPEPQPEPDWLAGLSDQAAIKRALLQHAFAGKRPKPIELEAAYRRRMGNREIARNLAALRDAGAAVAYRAVDIRDARAVRAVLAGVRAAHGPIRGLIHGAGVLADHRIEDKTAEQFDAVFDTKVAGLRNLLVGLGEDALRVLALFSSVSGRFGRQGQIDYAMANEVLNKLAQCEARRRPGCRVVAINWGPWEGGMVTPSLAREFERLGVGLIPLEAGAQAMRDELCVPPGREVEVVIGNGFDATQPDERPQAAPPVEQHGAAANESGLVSTGSAREDASPMGSAGAMDVVFERVLSLGTHPVLASHVIDTRPVWPLALTLEWLAAAAWQQSGLPHLLAVEDLRVFRGVVLQGDSWPVRVVAGRPETIGPETVARITELRGGADADVLHARARVITGAQRPVPPRAAPSKRRVETQSADRETVTPERIYGELLFHGPHFHAIETVQQIGPAGMVAGVRRASEPRTWMSDPVRPDWLTDPLVIDAGLQMGIVWCCENLGGPALPSRIGRYEQFCERLPAGPLVATLRVVEHDAGRLIATVDFCAVTPPDRPGPPAARLGDCEWTVSKALRAAFGRNRVIVPAGAGSAADG